MMTICNQTNPVGPWMLLTRTLIQEGAQPGSLPDENELALCVLCCIVISLSLVGRDDPRLPITKELVHTTTTDTQMTELT